MTTVAQDSAETREAFDRLLAALRPKLHRYCARMTGSVIDGEDVVQEALAKAIEAFAAAGPLGNPEGWLFRIAHNAALDHLRSRARQEAVHSPEDLDMMADPVLPAEQRLAAAAGLHTFMRLPVAQRSSIILMDVLGYSLDDIEAVTTMSVPAIKAALHRGRTRLHAIAQEPDDRPAPCLSEGERALLGRYVDRFNARDFDAVRDMLGQEVRLDLVNRRRFAGKETVTYFTNYAREPGWRCAAGFVDRRPAMLVWGQGDANPAYFVLLEWAEGRVATIRDFRYARYAVEGAEVVLA